jgi:hypothetical protein
MVIFQKETASQTLTNTTYCGIFVLMTIPGTDDARESGIWYNGTSARESDVAKVQAAIRNLGGLTLRVVRDPDEAREIVFSLSATELRLKYPDAAATDIDRNASIEAGRFVADMEPNANNSQDPLRLLRIESNDGSAVLASAISDEVRFRVKQGLAPSPITGEAVAYATLFPVDPTTLLE